MFLLILLGSLKKLWKGFLLFCFYYFFYFIISFIISLDAVLWIICTAVFSSSMICSTVLSVALLVFIIFIFLFRISFYIAISFLFFWKINILIGSSIQLCFYSIQYTNYYNILITHVCVYVCDLSLPATWMNNLYINLCRLEPFIFVSLISSLSKLTLL